MPKLDIDIIWQGTTPGRYFDNLGLGLFLRIRKDGSKQWGQRLGFDGKRVEIGLGKCTPKTPSEARSSLRAAQDRAERNHELAQMGVDPSTRSGRRVVARAQKPTFEDCARQRHAERAPTFSSERECRRWIRSLEIHAFPHIGGTPVDLVEPEDVKEMMLVDDFWQDTPVMARKVLQRTKEVLRYAKFSKYRTDNPTDDIEFILPKQIRRTVSYQSVPYTQMVETVEKIRRKTGAASDALLFQIFTAVRPGEVRLAEWPEINFDTRLWRIPAARMKGKREHIVPLPEQAMELLLNKMKDCPKIERSGLIFPSSYTGKAFTDVASIKVMRDLKINGVPHGFRSSFRTWVQEQTDIPREIAEAALAHINPNPVELAYARSDYLEKRRPLMQMWADYITGRTTGKVIDLHSA